MKETVLKYTDILTLTETKLDKTFLTFQILMDDLSMPYRLYKNMGSYGLYSGHNSKKYFRKTIVAQTIFNVSLQN